MHQQLPPWVVGEQQPRLMVQRGEGHMLNAVCAKLVRYPLDPLVHQVPWIKEHFPNHVLALLSPTPVRKTPFPRMLSATPALHPANVFQPLKKRSSARRIPADSAQASRRPVAQRHEGNPSAAFATALRHP